MSAFEPHHPGPLGESLDQGLSTAMQGTSRGTFGPVTIRHEPAVWSNAVKATKQNTRDTTAEDWTGQEEEADTAAFNEAVTIDDDETLFDFVRDLADYWEVSISALGWSEPEPMDQSRFEPPAFGKCPPHRNAVSCIAPLVGPRDCNVWELPLDKVEGLFDLRIAGSLEPIDTDWLVLVLSAWALLLDNLDIIEWIACILTGETAESGQKDFFGQLIDVLYLGNYRTLAECVTKSIQGIGSDVTIKLQDKEIEGSPFNTVRFAGGGKIRIRTQDSHWQDDYAGNYKEAPENSCERFCIIADLAATLLHELVHTCLADTISHDKSEDCRKSYLMENCFRWALAQRYPALVNEIPGIDFRRSACDEPFHATACWYYRDPQMWLHDGISWPNDPPFSCEKDEAHEQQVDVNSLSPPYWKL
jgi:hypothetical protein